jgi:hypothetical protein
MGTFDFLSGSPVATQSYNPSAMQAYSPAWNTGQPQGMDYSQVLSGGDAAPATQGLDWSKIAQWAQSKESPTANYQSALSALGNSGQSPMGGAQGQAPAMRGGMAGHALGQVNQGAAGFIGSGSPSMPSTLPVGLLSKNRGY